MRWAYPSGSLEWGTRLISTLGGSFESDLGLAQRQRILGLQLRQLGSGLVARHNSTLLTAALGIGNLTVVRIFLQEIVQLSCIVCACTWRCTCSSATYLSLDLGQSGLELFLCCNERCLGNTRLSLTLSSDSRRGFGLTESAGNGIQFALPINRHHQQHCR
jgi:hypothetical protein